MDKQVIYEMATNKIIKIVDEVPDLRTLDKSLDFISVSLWNEGMKSMGRPTIETLDTNYLKEQIKLLPLKELAQIIKSAFEEKYLTNKNLTVNWQIDAFIGQLID